MTLALAMLCGLLLGLYWGERSRRLDLLHVRRYQEERPPSTLLADGLLLGQRVPTASAEADRELSSESIDAAARYLRQESKALGRTLSPEDAERQARLMLAGQDV